MRRTLEREAERFGVAWTADTSDDVLERLITERKERGMTDVSQSDHPPCYGLFCDFGDEACKGCAIKDSCRHRFVTMRLPQLRAEVGNDPVKMAAKIDSDFRPEGILLALSYEKELAAQVEVSPPAAATMNVPFNGGYITRNYGGKGVPVVQIEMSRALYLTGRDFDEDRLTVQERRIKDLNEKVWKVISRTADNL